MLIPVLLFGQVTGKVGKIDTARSLTPGYYFVVDDSTFFKFAFTMQTTGIPNKPARGITYFSRGTSGFYKIDSLGHITRIDSVGGASGSGSLDSIRQGFGIIAIRINDSVYTITVDTSAFGYYLNWSDTLDGNLNLITQGELIIGLAGKQNSGSYGTPYDSSTHSARADSLTGFNKTNPTFTKTTTDSVVSGSPSDESALYIGDGWGNYIYMGEEGILAKTLTIDANGAISLNNGLWDSNGNLSTLNISISDSLHAYNSKIDTLKSDTATITKAYVGTLTVGTLIGGGAGLVASDSIAIRNFTNKTLNDSTTALRTDLYRKSTMGTDSTAIRNYTNKTLQDTASSHRTDLYRKSTMGTDSTDIRNQSNVLYESKTQMGTDTTAIRNQSNNLYQSKDADLTTYAGITPSANIQTLLGSADYAAMRSNMSAAYTTSPAFTTDIHAATAGGATLGTALLPFSSVYIGNAATNNLILTGTSAAARTWTIPDFGANASIVGSTLTTNNVDAANSFWGTSNNLIFEGATANTYETFITPTDATADQTITLPNATGTITVAPTSTTATQFFRATTTAGLGTWSVATDTITKAISWKSVAAGDSAIVFRVPQSGMTCYMITATCLGGTSFIYNVTKNGGGTNLMAGNQTIAASSGTFSDVTSLQNNTALAIGDILRVTLRTVTGTVTEAYVQLNFTKTQL